MIKWALVSQFDYIQRFELLSEILKSSYDLPNEFQALNCEIQEFPEKIEIWKREFKQLRIGPPFGGIVARDLDLSNARTMTLQTSDCLQNIDKNWWPRSLLDEAFLGVLAKSNCEIDIHAKAMIIGTGSSARATVLPLIKVGYSRISFTDIDDEKGLDFIRDLKKRIFNVQFDFVERNDISLLAGSYSLVINTTPDNAENSLVDDLSYFNYLKPGGLAIDLSVNSINTKFITQATLVKAQTIPGYIIASEVDAHWVNMCFDIDLDLEMYKKKLLDLISKD